MLVETNVIVIAIFAAVIYLKRSLKEIAQASVSSIINKTQDDLRAALSELNELRNAQQELLHITREQTKEIIAAINKNTLAIEYVEVYLNSIAEMEFEYRGEKITNVSKKLYEEEKIARSLYLSNRTGSFNKLKDVEEIIERKKE